MLLFGISGALSFLELPKKKTFSFAQLEILSFENSSCFRSECINYLPDLCTTLVEPNLNGCYRVTRTREFIDTLGKYTNTLRRLYLSRTRINDETVHFICQKLKHLNILNIKRSKRVTQNIVENLLALKQLEKLIANGDILVLYNQRKNQQ